MAGLDGVGVFDTSKLAVDTCRTFVGRKPMMFMHACMP